MLGDKAREFLKTLHHLDKIWDYKDVDLEYSELQLVQFAERYHEHKLNDKENSMKMNTMNFKTPFEMIYSLMKNEGEILKDSYGRQWKYDDYVFYFKDIGNDDEFEPDTLKCLHLYQTCLYYV